MEHIAATITLSRRCKSLGRIDTELADQQGRIKVEQRGHFPRPPPATRGPPGWSLLVSNKILVWKIFGIQKRYKNTTLYHIPTLR